MKDTYSSPLAPLNRWWKYRDLVRNLVNKELKVRYQGAFIGFAWSLMNPFLITLVYLFVFTYVFKSDNPNHALYIVTGIIHWTLFSNLMTQSPTLLVDNSDLLKKVYFPRLLIPFSNLLVNVVLWLMALGVFAALYYPLGGKPSVVILIYPIYLLMFLGFSFGLMLTFSVLHVEMRDTKHLVEIFIQLLFWATPILYPLKLVPEQLHILYALSPMSEFIQIFQHIFWAGTWPPMELTVGFLIWTLLSLALGMYLFYKKGAFLIEKL